MKLLIAVSAGWATLLTALVGVQCALGFGTPNVADGESIVLWWMFFWGLSFVSVPLGIFSAIAISKIFCLAYNLADR